MHHQELEMPPIRVVINGIFGKMGTETVSAVCHEDDLVLVGGTKLRDKRKIVTLPGGGEAPISSDLQEIIQRTHPDVLVDFTNATACMEAALIAATSNVNIVIGSSGLTDADLRQLDSLAQDKNIGIIVAPNFALGAVLLKRLVEQVVSYFDYVDIVEAHHETKIDAPSGFAMALARSISQKKQFTRNNPEREDLANTRGGEYNGVSVHSIRMPGRSSQHEVIMGATGQTLSLRHDTLGRDCFMPGVLNSIRAVVKRPGLVVGLENILGL
jgi:4-hydroxy-tetrahydrodipicolinate reductase